MSYVARKPETMIGLRFGRLVAQGFLRGNVPPRYRYRCICDCGTEIVASGNNLRSGNTSSCGCLHKEGLVRRNESHGKSGTRTYGIWAGIIKRCTNARSYQYADYGGRGIRVCERWRSFQNFLADMGEAPDGASIDRIDVNGNYEPQNCRWASRHVQANNKRTNHRLTYQGVTKTITEWANEFGHSHHLLRCRLRVGLSIEEALTKPNQRLAGRA